MKSRLLVAAAMLGLAGPSLAQNTTTTTTTPQPQVQTVPQQPQAVPQAVPQTTAQTVPQTTTAPATVPQPPSGSSQQVVVNPPSQVPAQPPAQTVPQAVPAPAATNVQVNPGAPAQTAYPQSSVVVEEHHRARSPVSIVLTDTLYGGGVGALIGLGVGLIEQGSYARDVLVGTGVGLLGGAAVGGIHAYSATTGNDIVARRAHSRDGLGTLAKDREMQRPIHQVAALTFNY